VRVRGVPGKCVREETRESRRDGIAHLGWESIEDRADRLRAAVEGQRPDVEQPRHRIARIHFTHLPVRLDGLGKVPLHGIGERWHATADRGQGIDRQHAHDEWTGGRHLA